MLPEVTNYVANGPAGPAKLAAGPNLASYRGLQIINTRKFSMESGTAPRDLLRRRVRVAEYYRVPWHPQNPKRSYEFYDQSRDTMFRMTWKELLEMSKMASSASESDGWTYDNAYWTVGKPWPDEKEPWDLANKSAPPDFSESVFSIGVTGLPEDVNENDRAMWNQLGNIRAHVMDHRGKDSLKMPQRLVSKTMPMYRAATEDNLAVAAASAQQNDVDSLREWRAYQQVKDLHVYSEVYGGGIFADCARLAPKWQGSEHQENINSVWQYLNWNQLHPLTYGNDRDNNLNAQQFIDAQSVDIVGQRAYLADTYRNTKTRFDTLCRRLPLIGYMESLMQGYGTAEDYRSLLIVNRALDWNEQGVPDMNADGIQPLLRSPDANVKSVEAYLLLARNNNIFNEVGKLAIVTPYAVGGENHGLLEVDKHMLTLANLQAYIAVGQQDPQFPQNHPLIQDNAIARKNVVSQACVLWAMKLYVLAMRALIQDAGGMPASVQECNFNQIKFALQAKCLQQAKNQFMFVMQQGQNAEAQVAQVAVPAALNGDAVRQFVTNMFNAAKALMSAEDVNNTRDFKLADLNPHHETPVNLILQPNMHLDRCTAVAQDDMRTSATSVRPDVWMLQSMLANMHLSAETCDALLARVEMPAALLEASMTFLLGKCDLEVNWNDAGRAVPVAVPAPQRAQARAAPWNRFFRNLGVGGLDEAIHPSKWMWNTKLMLWLMACMHPTERVREEANGLLNMDVVLKQQLAQTIAKGLLRNTKDQPDVEEQLQTLVNYFRDAPDTGCRYSTDIASNLFAAYTNVGNNGGTVKCVPVDIEKVPSEMPANLADDASFFHRGNFLSRGRGKVDCLRYCSANTDAVKRSAWHNADVQSMVNQANSWAMDPSNCEEILQHFVLILAKRFFKPSSKFMWNGTGMPVVLRNYDDHRACRYYSAVSDGMNANSTGPPQMPTGLEYTLLGEHLLHGPHVATHHEIMTVPGGAQDLLIMRPNIEHEMLGIIMGRGGEGELGATFWGQVNVTVVCCVR